MNYATLSGAMRRRRAEEWRRISAARDRNRRLAAALSGLPPRRDVPAGMLALSGPLFGRPDWSVEALSVWAEDRGEEATGLYLPQSGGGRVYTSRSGVLRIVEETLGLGAGRAPRVHGR